MYKLDMVIKNGITVSTDSSSFVVFDIIPSGYFTLFIFQAVYAKITSFVEERKRKGMTLHCHMMMLLRMMTMMF